ncbi:MAG: SDR family oxidoreductase, partial [Sporichthyaceae bacterium]|nr:SDR family oxidoreductase [Sporichthyaceae bacterium]
MSDAASAEAPVLPVVPPSTVVLVSGGSRGLGLAIVDDLVTHGVKVAAFARTITAELRAMADKHPDAMYVGAVDIIEPKAGEEFVRGAEAALGTIDGIVNNAAVGQDALHVHTAAEQVARIIGTNLT